MLMNLFKFKGGVKPPTNKTQSVGQPIAAAPLPSRLVVPLHQSIGGTPRPVVQAGDKVLKGQLIGEADGWISAAVHAPTSGTVVAVAMHVQPHPSGLDALCVVIEPDGKDEWITRQPVDYKALTPEQVRERLQQAGVVGLGGAVFPTHGKLTASKTVAMEEMVVNGAECEPFITCDDLLMRERAEEVVRGIGIFRDLLQPKKVLIGIEDNKPEAAEAMRAAVKAVGENFEVVAVPTLYPAGGAKQLIRVLTGKEVPASKRSTDLGVQCFNVATAYTAWRAIAHGEPVVSRLVTITGNVHEPRNYEVLIGTPMDELLKLATPHPDTDGIVMGGPMMGFLVPEPGVPVVKATNCLIAHSDRLFPPKAPEMPCIRCGSCAQACPHELQPFEMYWFSRAKNFGKTQEYHIFDCIECGCCSFVCPSRIPLVQYFRFAKSEIWAREREKNAADQAKERFEFKQFREEREKAEKAEKLAKAAAAQAAKKAAEAAAAAAAGDAPAPAAEATAPAPAAAPSAADAEKAAKLATIQAAMERAKAQREAAQPKNTDHLTPEQQRAAEEIESRRTSAGLVPPETPVNEKSE
ncbi:electron transport complex subunit RsxC [uncultured Dechloromonas sp.]|uniref:electron transport complex subunit RsxC n=1 Tax=uncultured Dechloromonas sp. TaxID=171719 RepID=UPI0025FB1345|nr:electron transport complex subunit RsxC [uncultured Dechloromonas sp.]